MIDAMVPGLFATHAECRHGKSARRGGNSGLSNDDDDAAKGDEGGAEGGASGILQAESATGFTLNPPI
jgi:hypothetical protein